MADIRIPISESKSKIHEKMVKAVADAKGELTGNSEQGSFEIPVAIGTIKGHYAIADGEIVVDVTQKPMLVSKRMIQEALEDFLNQA